mgnify:CR=1 FL=1
MIRQTILLLLIILTIGCDNNPTGYEPINTTLIYPDVTFVVDYKSTGDSHCEIGGTMTNNEDSALPLLFWIGGGIYTDSTFTTFLCSGTSLEYGLLPLEPGEIFNWTIVSWGEGCNNNYENFAIKNLNCHYY